MSGPLVSILMPAYNCEEFVGQAIEAVLTQSFSDFEFIIINDGSTDNTREVILTFDDKRIKYYENQKNQGIVPSLNRGLVMACGKYVLRTDADDIALVKMVENLVCFMEDHSDHIVCGGQMMGIVDGKLFKYPTDNETLKVNTLGSCPFSHSTVIFRLSLLREKNISYSASFLDAEDYALWSFLVPYGKFHNLDEVTLLYRESSSQVTANHKYILNRKESLSKIYRFHAASFFKLNGEEIGAYVAFMDGTTPQANQELEKLGKIVGRILEINKRAKLFDNSKLRRALFIRWYSICVRFPGSKLKALCFFLRFSFRGGYLLKLPHAGKLILRKYL